MTYRDRMNDLLARLSREDPGLFAIGDDTFGARDDASLRRVVAINTAIAHLRAEWFGADREGYAKWEKEMAR